MYCKMLIIRLNFYTCQLFDKLGKVIRVSAKINAQCLENQCQNHPKSLQNPIRARPKRFPNEILTEFENDAAGLIESKEYGTPQTVAWTVLKGFQEAFLASDLD